MFYVGVVRKKKAFRSFCCCRNRDGRMNHFLCSRLHRRNEEVAFMSNIPDFSGPLKNPAGESEVLMEIFCYFRDKKVLTEVFIPCWLRNLDEELIVELYFQSIFDLQMSIFSK